MEKIMKKFMGLMMALLMMLGVFTSTINVFAANNEPSSYDSETNKFDLVKEYDEYDKSDAWLKDDTLQVHNGYYYTGQAHTQASTTITRENGTKVEVTANIAGLEGTYSDGAYFFNGGNMSDAAGEGDSFAGVDEAKDIPALGVIIYPQSPEYVGTTPNNDHLNFDGEYPIAVLTLKFSEEVTNPILDFSGIGGYAAFTQSFVHTPEGGYVTTEEEWNALKDSYNNGSFMSTKFTSLTEGVVLNQVTVGKNIVVNNGSLEVIEKKTNNSGNYEKKFGNNDLVPSGTGTIQLTGTFSEAQILLTGEFNPFSYYFNNYKSQDDGGVKDGINGFHYSGYGREGIVLGTEDGIDDPYWQTESGKIFSENPLGKADENTYYITTGIPNADAWRFSVRLQKTEKVKFSKKALTENGEELKGATIKLTKEDGSLVKEWVTDGSVTEFELEDGKYTFTEVSAPDKYEVATAITFEVKGGKVTVKGTEVSGNTIVMVDKLKEVPPTEPKKEVFEGDTSTNIDGKAVKPGQELTYTITYKNTKGKEADVTITDKIPTHTEFISADNGGNNENGIVTWKKKVAEGETLRVSFKVKVAGDVKGEVLKNTAKVNDGEGDFDTNEVTNPTPTPPTKKVFKGTDTTDIDGKEVKVGETLTYKVSYHNTTGKSQKVVIEDKIPEFTSYVEGSADSNGVYKDGKIIWTKENVAAGETFEVTFKVKVEKSASGKTLINEALVRAGKNEFKTNKTTNPVPEIPPTPEKTKVKFSKKALTENGEELKGATIKLTKEDGSLVKEWVTDGSVTEFELEDGKYTFTEVSAPDKYEVATAITFEVKGGKVTVKGTEVSGNTIVMVDKLKEVPPTEPKKPGTLPKTGDGTNISLYAGLILLAGSMLLLLGIKRRKNEK
ncbi:SpaA isopeptide-forming pilin-related protein [Enterococcus faecalis]